MNFKFTITCKACGCRSELTAGKWAQLGQFHCQNCGTTMDNGIYLSLCNAATSLGCVLGESNFFSISLGDNLTVPHEK